MISQGKVLANLLMIVWLFPTFAAKGDIVSKDSEHSMERIEVTGKPPKHFFRERLYLAQENFFELFNQLTQDEAFKVTCERRKQHAFTRLTERVCEAQFVSDIKHENLARASEMQSKKSSALHLGDKSKYRKQYKEMQQKQLQHMVELLNSNTKLRQQFQALQQAKNQFDQYDEE
ncbi:MAG: hypothetical protein ACFHVJ_01360 [Aestuariibacter sp.]